MAVGPTWWSADDQLEHAKSAGVHEVKIYSLEPSDPAELGEMAATIWYGYFAV